MTRASFILTTTLLALGGCDITIESSDSPGSTATTTVVVNSAPTVEWADAGCYWDSYYWDDIWFFEADVGDPDGAYDVVAVYADVYDSFDGSWADSFELYPTDWAEYWFSDWLGSSTYLDCYYGDYVVDLVAYDSYDSYDVLTVEPVTYW